jgi:two-component system chemotaxis sensor kinase CheA
MNDAQELLQEFLLDSKEAISRAEDCLLKILSGQAQGDYESHISEVMRLFHSVKGGSGFLKLTHLGTLAHAAESLIDSYQDLNLKCSEEEIDALCKCCDLIMEIFEHLEETATEGITEGDLEECLQRLRGFEAHQEPGTPGDPQSIIEQEVNPQKTSSQDYSPILVNAVDTLKTDYFILTQFPDETEYQASCLEALQRIQEETSDAQNQEIASLAKKLQSALEGIFSQGGPIDPSLIEAFEDSVNEILKTFEEGSVIAQTNVAIEEPVPDQPSPVSPDPSIDPESKPIVQQNIRVDMNQLDTLVNMFGELLITQDQVIFGSEAMQSGSGEFEKKCETLSILTRRLYELTLSLRMVPLSPVFAKVRRVIHDTSRKCAKKVELSMSGEETRIDKRLVELISDPLMHIARNCIDHGIEDTQTRLSSDKESYGTVELKALQEGSEIAISLRDDGAGLDRNRILKKAVEQGVNGAINETSPDEEIFSLIFQPGFSTAAEVTDISGRGVGMDVVHANIVQKLHGKVLVNSTFGQGTCFTMKIPATLSILEGMLVEVGSTFYSIPLVDVREALKPSEGEIQRNIDQQELLHLRGRLIPIIRLHQLHRIEQAETQITRGMLVIVGDEDSPVALLVDKVQGRQQIVIKPLATFGVGSQSLSGCTVLGSGEISLVLNIDGIIRAASEEQEVSY